MWLLPAFSVVSNAAGRIYYRLHIAGQRVPRSGPVLLVANHPNSLLDPMLVAAAARRPVRFLAKAPLFGDRKVGWLVRGAGAIPVYRRVDDPQAMGGNVDMFRAVYRELAGGAALGIFPEGKSHSEPGLAPLKTGAARIALGTLAHRPEAFPIMPVGLVFRRKDVFRSEALVIVGPAVEWNDLAPRGGDDREAVRELTRRIEDGMRKVTVNLERWEDQPILDCAEAVWRAEWGADTDPAAQVARFETGAAILAGIRQRPHPRWSRLAEDVEAHRKRLQRLGISPGDLKIDVGLRSSLRWALRRFYLLGIPALAVALAGAVLFWPPFRLTGRVARALGPEKDQRSTFKLLSGIPAYLLWIGLLAVLAWDVAGLVAGMATLVLVPTVGIVGLWIRERWRGAWRDARRFFLLRSQRSLVQVLQERQREIAQELRELYAGVRSRAP
jgi:glycerol-3-phosphate O-acyltransferase/dihydroxyacetone phosphate acyltransferase